MVIVLWELLFAYAATRYIHACPGAPRHFSSTMFTSSSPLPTPSRKKAKTDHIRDVSTTSTPRTTRTSDKATNTVTTNMSNDRPRVALGALNVVKLRRGRLGEIPNFAVEIQLMVWLGRPQQLYEVHFPTYKTCTRKELVRRLSAGRFDFSLGYPLYGFEAPTSSKRWAYILCYSSSDDY